MTMAIPLNMSGQRLDICNRIFRYNKPWKMMWMKEPRTLEPSVSKPQRKLLLWTWGPCWVTNYPTDYDYELPHWALSAKHPETRICCSLPSGRSTSTLAYASSGSAAKGFRSCSLRNVILGNSCPFDALAPSAPRPLSARETCTPGIEVQKAPRSGWDARRWARRNSHMDIGGNGPPPSTQPVFRRRSPN